jgi:hypothetical protein
MVIVIWDIDGFHVVDLMTEEHCYNIQYFLGHLLEPLLLAVFPDGRKLHSLQLDLYFDNCRVPAQRPLRTFR